MGTETPFLDSFPKEIWGGIGEVPQIVLEQEELVLLRMETNSKDLSPIRLRKSLLGEHCDYFLA